MEVSSNIIDVFVKLIRALECPVCYEYVASPIWQCEAGHIICDGCKSSVLNCPTCRRRFSAVRVRSLEHVSDLMLFPCKNDGCDRMLPLNEMRDHEHHCTLANANSLLDSSSRTTLAQYTIWKHIEQHITPFLVTSNNNREKGTQTDVFDLYEPVVQNRSPSPVDLQSTSSIIETAAALILKSTILNSDASNNNGSQALFRQSNSESSPIGNCDLSAQIRNDIPSTSKENLPSVEKVDVSLGKLSLVEKSITEKKEISNRKAFEFNEASKSVESFSLKPLKMSFNDVPLVRDQPFLFGCEMITDRAGSSKGNSLETSTSKNLPLKKKKFPFRKQIAKKTPKEIEIPSTPLVSFGDVAFPNLGFRSEENACALPEYSLSGAAIGRSSSSISNIKGVEKTIGKLDSTVSSISSKKEIPEAHSTSKNNMSQGSFSFKKVDTSSTNSPLTSVSKSENASEEIPSSPLLSSNKRFQINERRNHSASTSRSSGTCDNPKLHPITTHNSTIANNSTLFSTLTQNSSRSKKGKTQTQSDTKDRTCSSTSVPEGIPMTPLPVVTCSISSNNQNFQNGDWKKRCDGNLLSSSVAGTNNASAAMNKPNENTFQEMGPAPSCSRSASTETMWSARFLPENMPVEASISLTAFLTDLQLQVNEWKKLFVGNSQPSSVPGTPDTPTTFGMTNEDFLQKQECLFPLTTTTSTPNVPGNLTPSPAVSCSVRLQNSEWKNRCAANFSVSSPLVTYSNDSSIALSSTKENTSQIKSISSSLTSMSPSTGTTSLITTVPKNENIPTECSIPPSLIENGLEVLPSASCPSNNPVNFVNNDCPNAFKSAKINETVLLENGLEVRTSTSCLANNSTNFINNANTTPLKCGNANETILLENGLEVLPIANTTSMASTTGSAPKNVNSSGEIPTSTPTLPNKLCFQIKEWKNLCESHFNTNPSSNFNSIPLLPPPVDNPNKRFSTYVSNPAAQDNRSQMCIDVVVGNDHASSMDQASGVCCGAQSMQPSKNCNTPILITCGDGWPLGFEKTNVTASHEEDFKWQFNGNTTSTLINTSPAAQTSTTPALNRYNSFNECPLSSNQHFQFNDWTNFQTPFSCSPPIFRCSESFLTNQNSLNSPNMNASNLLFTMGSCNKVQNHIGFNNNSTMTSTTAPTTTFASAGNVNKLKHGPSNQKKMATSKSSGFQANKNGYRFNIGCSMNNSENPATFTPGPSPKFRFNCNNVRSENNLFIKGVHDVNMK